MQLQIFEQFCPKAGDANPLVAEPKQIVTQNGHSRSFKVIYFGIIEQPHKQIKSNLLKAEGPDGH